MLIEKAQHSIGAVTKCVGMFAVLDKAIGPTKIRADIATGALRVKCLWLIVSGDRQWFNCYLISITQPISVFDWKVTINPAPDRLAFHANLDGFRDFDHAIRKNANVTVKAQNPFVGNNDRRQ